MRTLPRLLHVTCLRQLTLAAVIVLATHGAASAQQPAPPPDAPDVPVVEPTFEIAGTVLTVSRGEEAIATLELPCAAVATHRAGEKLLVACGPEGLVVVDLSTPEAPAVAAHQAFDASVTGAFEADGRIWVKLAREEARPLDAAPTAVRAGSLAGALGPAPDASGDVEEPKEPQAAAPAPAVVGQVVEVGDGNVVIDLGEADGLKRKDNIELFVEVERSLGGGETAIEERRLAVGKVAAISSDRASVDLGINEEVPDGAKARLTDDAATSNMLMPRRADGLWEVGFMARPFLALGTLGFGTVSQVWVAHRFESPLVARVLIEPLGLGFAEEGNVLAAAGNVVVAYDTRLFEVGLGLGWSAVNDEPGSSFASDSSSGRGDDQVFERVRSGLSIVQSVRLGARDGLALMANNAFVLHDSEFLYGGTSGVLQIPTTSTSWLLLSGGGGVAGYWYGDIGLRVLMTGNGEKGSTFINATLGAAGVFGEEDCDEQTDDACWDGVREISYGGPAAGIGFEWRF